MIRIILAVLFVLTAVPAFAADKESAYDRVMKTRTIRCGWGTNDPWVYKDLQTGEMAGLTPAIMKEVADQLGFKLDWQEETGWSNLPTALETGRVDVACSTLWRDPARSTQAAYTRPAFYQPLYAYARAGDTRFTGKPGEINNKDVRIAVQEGDVNASLAASFFPQAQTLALPQTAQWSDAYLSVTTGKADVTFADPVGIAGFNAAQTVKLERIPLPRPVTIYGASFAVGIHEHEMKEVIDAAVAYLIDTGRIDELTKDFLKKHPGALIPVAKSYETAP